MKASGDGVGRDLGPTFLLGSRLSAQKGRGGREDGDAQRSGVGRRSLSATVHKRSMVV